jgi:Uma2 family endonuclease
MQLTTNRFDVEQYHLMNIPGILTEDDRVELINGEIVEMSPIGRFHAAYVNRLTSLFTKLLGDLVIVSVQNPVILNNLSEPQPDVTLLKPKRDFYKSGIAQVSDVFLLVEVADTTLKYDRDIKIPLYAKNGVAEVWLVNIVEQIIVVYSQPKTDGYQEVKIFQPGDNLILTAFPNISFAVNQILLIGD